MWHNSLSVNAGDQLALAYCRVAVTPYRATAVLHQTAWRYGVADSIKDFESLDPGSNPGTSAGLCSMGHGVMESMFGCGPFDPGSTPGVPTSQTHGGA